MLSLERAWYPKRLGTHLGDVSETVEAGRGIPVCAATGVVHVDKPEEVVPEHARAEPTLVVAAGTILEFGPVAR